MALSTGQILNNRYRIVRLLGQGGFGAVYRAWDLNLSVPCAVKENFDASPEAQRQFLREARLLHVLRHPNLPLVKDHFVIACQGQYLVMDFVEGQDLEELRCAAGGRLPEAQVLGWISQICEALDYMHRQNPPVIHRDLKPANIKITPAGQAVLVDFGIAKTYDPLLKTTLGARAVTPGYSPIEQYGTGVTDARTDLYSLGATLYTLLTGKEPPEAPQRVLHDPLLPPRQFNPAISPALEATLLHALQVDPEQRFQSAAEFKTALPSPLGEGLGVRYVSSQPAVVTQPPAPFPRPAGQAPAARGVARGGAAPALSPITPAALGVPQPQLARSFPWKWAGMGAGLLVGMALLAVVAGLVVQGISNSRLTQTAQARASQTAQARAVLLSQTVPFPNSTLTPTFTSTPSPTLTPTPSPLPPSSTPTATRIPSATSVPVYTVSVSSNSAYIRTGPGLVYTIIISYPKGTTLTAVGRDIDGTWLVVILLNGQQGWVSVSVLNITFDVMLLPVITAPPTPIPPTPTEPISYGAAILVPPGLQGVMPLAAIHPARQILSLVAAAALLSFLAFQERHRFARLAYVTIRQTILLMLHLLTH